MISLNPIKAWFNEAKVWVCLALIIAALAAIKVYGHEQYKQGAADDNAKWVAAQAKADRQAKADQDKRDATAAQIAVDTSAHAQSGIKQIQQQTAKAVEKVKYVTRTIRTPADCPALPASVSDEGRAAVERANAANRALRTGQH